MRVVLPSAYSPMSGSPSRYRFPYLATGPFAHLLVDCLNPVVVPGPFPALAFSVENLPDQVLSVQVEIAQIDGEGDCAHIFRLEPERTFRYSCPQRSVAAGQSDRGDLRIYEDWGETKLAEHRHCILAVQTGPGDELTLTGRVAK